MLFWVGLALLGLVFWYGCDVRRRQRKTRDPRLILTEVDRLDVAEAPEEEFQPLFDELLLSLAHRPDEAIECEVVHRMNTSEGPSRRMFLQLCAVLTRLTPALRELSEKAHPLAPEAKDLLRRRETVV